ncbi:MAG: hypothetical protein QXT74_02170 [Candidatus Nezhaarchaeales archaeon]
MKGRGALLCALVAVAIAAVLAQAAQASRAERAEALVSIAEGACARAEGLASSVNATVAAAAGPALRSRLEGALSLVREASGLVGEAKLRLQAGDVDGALERATQAMQRVREAFVSLNAIRKEARPEEAEAMEARDKALGLLVAANRTLERAMRLNVSTEDLSAIISRIRSLVAEGNVSGAAHELARANQLVAQAFSEMKSKAEEGLAERAAAFVERLCERQEELRRRAGQVGLNATGVFESAGLGDLSRLRERLKGAAPGDVRDLVGQLKEAGRRLSEVAGAVAAIEARAPKEAPRRIDIIDLINNAPSWAGEVVTVRCAYCGQRPPEGLPGPSGTPPEGSWIGADRTGWIYVVDAGALKPRTPIFEGDLVEVTGSLKVEAGVAPYIEAQVVVIVSLTTPPAIPSPPAAPIITPPAITPPPAPHHALGITIVGRGAEGKQHYVVKVRLVNVGADAVVFPNGAYGIVVEREVGGGWSTFYVPISAQVLVKLLPGEERVVTLRLLQPPEGNYRVVAEGWLESSRQRVSAAVEFAIP